MHEKSDFLEIRRRRVTAAAQHRAGAEHFEEDKEEKKKIDMGFVSRAAKQTHLCLSC